MVQSFSFILLLFITFPLFGQSAKYSSKNVSTLGKIYNGLSESVELYDLPILAAYLGRNAFLPNNSKTGFKIGSSSLDMEISESYANSKNHTLGSVDKDMIPDLIFYSRLAITTSLDIFTDSDISPTSFRQIFLFKKSLLYTYTLNEYIKNFVYRERPDKSDSRSFFSGHTSTAFAASTFLYRELNDFYDKWEVTRTDKSLRTTFKTATFGALYGWAGFVGYSRIRDGKHYLSDVLTGALVGTAVSYIVYELYNNKEKSIPNFNLSVVNKSFFVSYQMQM